MAKLLKKTASDPDFGWKEIGTSSKGNLNYIDGGGAIPTESGNAISITVHTGSVSASSDDKFHCALYNASYHLLGVTEEKTGPWGVDWHTLNFPSPVEIIEGNLYYIVVNSNTNSLSFQYQSGVAGYKMLYHKENPYADGFPDLIVSPDIYDNYAMSIFCSYELLPPPSPNRTDKNNYNGYLAFIQQYIRHRIAGTTPWKNPDGTILE